MKKILILCTAVILCACSTRKVSTEQTDYARLASELREMVSRYEKRTEVYRDSLALMKGLAEKSSNLTDSVSHLETSYAMSDAEVRNGRLHHSIENKDSVPGRVKYVFIGTEKRDTVLVERTDTVYREKKVYKETVKEKGFLWNTFFYASGWIAWIIAGAGIWFRYKVKKNEK